MKYEYKVTYSKEKMLFASKQEAVAMAESLLDRGYEVTIRPVPAKA